MRDSFLVFGSPLIGEEEIAEVVDSLRSGWIGTGPKVQRFESMIADYVGAQHCRCVSSCTAALILAMQALGHGAGDEVLVPCVPDASLIDLDAAEAAITPNTKAIMPVHIAGRPIDMERLEALSAKHRLIVIEEPAHAIGAEWRGRRIGAFGNVT